MQKRIIATAVAMVFNPLPRFAPLALEVEKLDAVPENVRSLYKEVDGKFRLDVDGVEDVSGLKASVAAAREDAKREKAEKQRLAAIAEQYKDLPDAKSLKEMLEKFQGDDEQAMIKRGEIDKVFERRTAKLAEAHTKVLTEKQKEIEARDAKLSKYEQRVLADHIRSAVIKAGAHKEAVDDAVLHARSIFTLDDDANAVHLEDGKPVLAAGGKPYSPDHWIEEMKEKKPHWFPGGSTGGGASNTGAGGAKTIKRSAFTALDARAQSAKMKEGFKVVDD